MENLKKTLSKHPFCSGLNARFFALLSESAASVHFAPEQLIFQERFEAKHLYLIVDGVVAVETFVPGRGNIVIQRLGRGEALGWSWLFPPYQWQFTARAIEPADLIALNATRLREQIEQNPDFGLELRARIAGILLERLQATRRRLVEFYGPTE